MKEMMKHTLLYIAVSGMTLLTSCQLGKHYTRPDLHLPQQLDTLRQQDTLSIADMQWWEIYTDTTLQSLIEKTLDNNKDMKIAAARVKELAAMKRIDFANLFPQLNGSAYAQKEGSNYGGDNYKNDPEQGGKLTVTWELDLWGNLRWAKDKSIAQFLGSIEAQRALKMSIVSEVAQAYFELVALDNELNIVRQTLYARKEGVRLAKLRFEGGLTSETSYQQAQVEYARTATLVPELERKISLKENDIAFLARSTPVVCKCTASTRTFCPLISRSTHNALLSVSGKGITSASRIGYLLKIVIATPAATCGQSWNRLMILSKPKRGAGTNSSRQTTSAPSSRNR